VGRVETLRLLPVYLGDRRTWTLDPESSPTVDQVCRWVRASIIAPWFLPDAVADEAEDAIREVASDLAEPVRVRVTRISGGRATIVTVTVGDVATRLTPAYTRKCGRPPERPSAAAARIDALLDDARVLTGAYDGWDPSSALERMASTENATVDRPDRRDAGHR
jgi:hypothetical protein